MRKSRSVSNVDDPIIIPSEESDSEDDSELTLTVSSLSQDTDFISKAKTTPFATVSSFSQDPNLDFKITTSSSITVSWTNFFSHDDLLSVIVIPFLVPHGGYTYLPPIDTEHVSEPECVEITTWKSLVSFFSTCKLLVAKAKVFFKKAQDFLTSELKFLTEAFDSKYNHLNCLFNLVLDHMRKVGSILAKSIQDIPTISEAWKKAYDADYAMVVGDSTKIVHGFAADFLDTDQPYINLHLTRTLKAGPLTIHEFLPIKKKTVAENALDFLKNSVSSRKNPHSKTDFGFRLSIDFFEVEEEDEEGEEEDEELLDSGCVEFNISRFRRRLIAILLGRATDFEKFQENPVKLSTEEEIYPLKNISSKTIIFSEQKSDQTTPPFLTKIRSEFTKATTLVSEICKPLCAEVLKTGGLKNISVNTYSHQLHEQLKPIKTEEEFQKLKAKWVSCYEHILNPEFGITYIFPAYVVLHMTYMLHQIQFKNKSFVKCKLNEFFF